MALKAKAPLAETLWQSRSSAAKLSQEVGRKHLRSVLQQAQLDLNARLAQASGLTNGLDTFTAYKMQVALRQVQAVVQDQNKKVTGLMLEQAGTAADTATAGFLKYMHGAERKFRGIVSVLPLDEAMMFDRARNGAEASILSRIASNPQDPAGLGILQRYGMNVVQNFEDRLRGAVLTSKPWGEVRSDLIAESPFLQQAPASWAERIVRTETMGAYNRAGWETTRAADEVLGDMVKILSATFDDRTGWDSFQVHGQIRRPSEAFEWDGRAFQHPPNRPNDREVVVPHRVSWPIPPELAWLDDGEVLDRWAEEGRKGTPPDRPLMTTVPLESFGRS